MADVKLIRKQIKNVLSEVKEEFVSSSLAQGVEKALTSKIESKLMGIEAMINAELAKQDKRAKDVQGYLIQVVKGSVQASLHDFDLTIESIVEVLADSGLVVTDFDAKVKEKKATISKARSDAAGKKLIDEAAARAQAAQQATTEETPAVTPADQVADANPTQTTAQA